MYKSNENKFKCLNLDPNKEKDTFQFFQNKKCTKNFIETDF